MFSLQLCHITSAASCAAPKQFMIFICTFQRWVHLNLAIPSRQFMLHCRLVKALQLTLASESCWRLIHPGSETLWDITPIEFNRGLINNTSYNCLCQICCLPQGCFVSVLLSVFHGYMQILTPVATTRQQHCRRFFVVPTLIGAA